MTTTASQARNALRAGRDAARRGRPITANPYRADAVEARVRVLARAWMIGYQGGNPVTVDYTS